MLIEVSLEKKKDTKKPFSRIICGRSILHLYLRVFYRIDNIFVLIDFSSLTLVFIGNKIDTCSIKTNSEQVSLNFTRAISEKPHIG